jgi:type 1 glutamine amidotransferase
VAGGPHTRRTRHRGVAVLVVAAALLVTAGASPQTSATGLRVLAFTKTTGFRHGSIPVAVDALRSLGARSGFAVDATEDAAAFTDANLARYDVVAFLLTTGDVLDAAGQSAFERYVASGGGYVGVHSASDTEYDWPWYGGLVGAYFNGHPAIQQAAVVVADAGHPSTRPLPQRWVRTDEWYAFRTNPRGRVHVLATIDESSYDPDETRMGDHPIAWSHEYAGGRAWYTAGGHTDESYAEPLFLAHLLGGIRWAAGPAVPVVRSLGATVRGRRVAVVVRHATCRRCAAVLRVRSARVALRGDAQAARGSVVLPRGRWQLVVTVENRASGRTASVRRTVRVG